MSPFPAILQKKLLSSPWFDVSKANISVRLLLQRSVFFSDTGIITKRGEGTVDWDTVASNCSTGNCLSNFNRRISSKSSNWEIWARWGLPTISSPLPKTWATDLSRAAAAHQTWQTWANREWQTWASPGRDHPWGGIRVTLYIYIYIERERDRYIDR